MKNQPILLGLTGVLTMLALATGCTIKSSNPSPSSSSQNASQQGADQNAGQGADPNTDAANDPNDGSSSGGGATGAGGGHGNVPPELVGTWTSHGGGAVIVHTYAGDGSYHESSGLSTSAGTCTMTSAFEIDGTVDFAASGVVTYHEVDGTVESQTCSSSNKTSKPISPSTLTKSWRLDAGVLYTWDSTCNAADYKTCAVELTK